jgi:hypothetical protein
MVRGVVIAALMVIYGWIRGAPQPSFTLMLLVGALLQFLVILIRRFLPADQLARAQDVFELVADGVTVLCFALGVYGGIARIPAGV